MKVKEIASINPKSQKYNDFINYIDTSSVDNGFLNGVKFLSSNWPSRAQREIQNNDILISSVRPNLRHNWFAKNIPSHCVGSTGFIQIRVISPNCLPQYLFYYLTSSNKVSFYSSVADSSQTTFPAFNKDIIGNIILPFVTLKEQQHIVDTIGTIDKLIENLSKQRAKIHQLLLLSVESIENTSLAKNLNLEIIHTGVTDFDGLKTYFDTSSVNENGPIDYSEKINFNSRPSRANSQPISGSVWFSKMKGSNKTILVTSHDKDLFEDSLFSTGFMGLKANQNFPLELLYSIVISKSFLKARDKNSTGTLMEGVTNSTFGDITFPKLNLAESLKYHRKWESLVETLSKIRREELILQKEKDTLLKKYFE